jgi:hypothetical protein
MTDRTVQTLLDSLYRYERLALSLNEENKKLLAMNADIVAMANEAVFQRDGWKTEAGKLKAERDEARRMYCGRVSRDVPLDAFEIAKNHGWDCFPQEDGK